MKCCNLNAGKLRHQIKIMEGIETPDGGGGHETTPNEVASVRAYIKPMSGTERFHAGRLETDITHRVYIRYPKAWTVDGSNWITYGARTFEVRAAINLEEKNQWLEVYAVEGPAS